MSVKLGFNAGDTQVRRGIAGKRLQPAQWCSSGFALLAIGWSTVTLLRWTSDLPRFARWGLDGFLMKPNCAVAAALAGFGLLALILRHHRIALINGAAIAVLGGAKLIEHLAQIGVGLRSVSLTGLWVDEAVIAPGRIGLLASIGFTLMGIGFVVSAAGERARIRDLAPWLGLSAAFVSLLAMTGYLFGADQSHAVPQLARFAVQSAAINFCLGLAMILAFPQLQPLRTFLADSAAGLLARRALPFVVIFPLAMGWLYVVGQDAGLHDTSTGSAVLILALIVLMCFILGWGVAAVGARERELEALQEEQIRAELVLKSARDQFVILDRNWRLAYLNDRFAELTGRGRASMLGHTLAELWPGIVDSPLESAVQLVVDQQVETALELFDASDRRWFDVRLYPAPDRGVALLFLDITDRKRIEAAIRDRERELQLMTDLAPVLLARCDAQHRYQFVNAPYAQLFERNSAEMIGKHMSEVLGDQLYQSALPHIESVLAGKSVDFEITFKPPGDGAATDSRKVLRVAYAPERDNAQRVNGFIAAMIDISERKAMEEELQHRLTALTAVKERLRSVVDHVVDGIITIDEAGIVQSLNPSAEKLFGYSASEVIGRNVRMLMPEPYQSSHDGFLRNYMQTGIPRIIGIGREVLGLRSDGSTFPMDLAVSTYTLEQRRYFTGIIRDITERKDMERELHQLVDELRVVDQRKDEFLATLAHELRNPLSPLRNSLEVLNAGNASSAQHELARKTMERQVALMERLIDDLMDVSRITRNRLELRRESVDLQTVLQQALDVSRPLAEKRNHVLDVDLPNEPIPLEADSVRLAQVFGNLLANACKYTDPGGRIQLRAQQQSDRVEVTIADNGIGIPGPMLHRIFDMFTQVDDTLERAHGGLGIGLTLAKRLVELHGGDISAHSDGPGTGSRFIVQLPVTRTVPVAPQHTPDLDAESIRGLRILIVDDNRDAAASLETLLQLHGSETQVAHDGQEALDRASTFHPNAVLLDIGLPKINGFDVCRALRQTEWGKGAVILALTGWGQDEDRQQSRQAGFDGHLTKPVEKSMLLQALNRRMQHA